MVTLHVEESVKSHTKVRYSFHCVKTEYNENTLLRIKRKMQKKCDLADFSRKLRFLTYSDFVYLAKYKNFVSKNTSIANIKAV